VRTMPGTMKWVGLAVIGLVITIAVALAASALISQQIGITSEPISAGDALAPQPGGQQTGSGGQQGETTKPAPEPAPTEASPEASPPEISPEPAPAPEAPPASEPQGEHSGGESRDGGGSGGGGGHGGGDD
jgi:hypothetical protein